MKVAVIGSGAAAAGVLAGLEHYAPPACEVTVFDIGEQLVPGPEALPPACLGRDEIAAIYRKVQAEQGKPFPPPKTHFGQSLSKHPVDGRPTLWKSEHRGGLTNFWGGGMFPFTDREFEAWPVNAREMAPYYRLIADKVGICGEKDALNGYFGEDFINRPPLRTSSVVQSLAAHVNGRTVKSGGMRILAGSSRLALETRAGDARSCHYCGECMLGCPWQSVWSSARELDWQQRKGTVSSYVPARVRYLKDRRIYYEIPGREGEGIQVSGPYDRIYLAAGVIGTTEIVMRSLGIRRGPRMVDTAIRSFPIFYLGGIGGVRGENLPYFSLCNLSLMAVPDSPTEPAAQVSVYPAFDHLWRYYVQESVWSAMESLGRAMRWRLLLGRVYLTGAADSELNFELVDDHLVIHHGRAPDAMPAYRPFLAAMRDAVRGSAFFIPKMPPIGHGTSSHYGSTFPYGGDILPVRRDGKIADGIYLSDASAFPAMPAISPTFTIMANASRIVFESLQD